MSAAFFDTNILVYAVDPRDASREKQLVARDLVSTRRCTLSTQVMMETFNTLRRLDLLARDLAKAYLARLSAYSVVTLEADDVLKALDMGEKFKVSHRDGLILRAAEKARTPILYSEHLNHGQSYGPVRVCNPFIQDFLA